MVTIKLSIITKGNKSLSASNNASTSWVPETTEQNLIKFMFYHVLQVNFSVNILE